MERTGGGDSEGMGTRPADKRVVVPAVGSIGEIPKNAACGTGSSGAVEAGAHVEQHIEAWVQLPAGTSPHPS